MELPKNRFKHGLARGELQIGLWCSLCSNIAAEIVAHSGYDWLVLDTEHSPNEIPDLVSQLQAVQTGTATAMVRPPDRKSTRLNSSHIPLSRMPSSA